MVWGSVKHGNLRQDALDKQRDLAALAKAPLA